MATSVLHRSIFTICSGCWAAYGGFLSRAWFGCVRAGGSCTAVSRQHQFVLREKAAGKVRCEPPGSCPL
jgi:hypothetical protein